MAASSSSAAAATTLDKSKFDTTLPLVALRIPAKLCTQYMTTLRDQLFQRPRMKRILDAPPSTTTTIPPEELLQQRLVLLGETVDMSLSALSPELQQFIRDNGPGVPESYSLKLGYDNLSVEEVLRTVLPQGAEIPSSFEQAGHIAHLNLREEMLPYKQLIGQVILDKNPALRTVVNKMGNIENEFRTFPMEVLAGVDDLNVTVRESGAKFTFNFRNVYWNSRLQTEHARLIQLLVGTAKKRATAASSAGAGAGSGAGTTLVVADMMAGVGPFAVPLAMSNEQAPGPSPPSSITVYANDLNPESYASLTLNARANHCSPRSLVPSNMDARAFVLDLVRRGVRFDEAIMNLPANATDFLDVFVGLETRFERAAALAATGAGAPVCGPAGLAGAGAGEAPRQPRIHVYGFSSAADVVADMVERVAGVLRCPVSCLGFEPGAGPGAGVGAGAGAGVGAAAAAASAAAAAHWAESAACWGHVVRDVSPKKMMVCISFRLPLQVARAEPLDLALGSGEAEGDGGEGDGEAETKRRKVE